MLAWAAHRPVVRTTTRVSHASFGHVVSTCLRHGSRGRPHVASLCVLIISLLLLSLVFVGRFGRPEGEVVTQQLHDESRVLVRILRQRV